MTSEGLGEMFEGDSADMCAGNFLLISIFSDLFKPDDGDEDKLLYVDHVPQNIRAVVAEILNSIYLLFCWKVFQFELTSNF